MKLMKQTRAELDGQRGYLLLAVMLLITLMLIALSVEAPRIAQQIKRQKEEELVHRGMDMALAIKRFYHKQGTYPTSLDQLEDTNHVRFLRKKYIDPMTGEANWRVIHQGEAQVKIPQNSNQGGTIAGLPGATPAGAQTPGTAGSPGFGSPAGIGTTGSGPGNGQQNSGVQAGATAAGTNPGQLGNSFGTPIGASGIGSGQTFGGGAIIGVASVSKEKSIKEFNEKDHYNEWLFVYDPRVERAGGTGIVVAEPMASAGGTGQSPDGSSAPGTTSAPPGSTSAPGSTQPGATPTPVPR